MRIRDRRPEDLPACATLLRRVFETSRYPARWPADPEDWLAGHPDDAGWVVQDGGEIVGHVQVRRGANYRVWPAWRDATRLADEQLGVLCRLFVSPLVRRRGIAGALIERCEAHATERGLCLVLDVTDQNRAAIALYDRLGWRRAGEDVLTLADGSPLPLILYVQPTAPVPPARRKA